MRLLSVTSKVFLMTNPLTKSQAKIWVDEVIVNGTGDVRLSYVREFEVGETARRLWNDPTFTLGIEYGILIAVVKIYSESSE